MLGLRRAVLLGASVVAPVAAALTVGTVPAAAAGHSFVGYGPGGVAACGANYCWAPGTATINTGDSVTFSNGAGFHGLNEVSGPWPASCPQGNVGSCTLTAAGTYAYNCSIHGDAMKGRITVQGSAPPPPPPTATPAPTQSTVPAPTHSQPAPMASTAVPKSPAASAAAAASPTPEVVALAPSPSPTDGATPGPSPAPTIAPAPASASGTGGPLPLVIVVVIVAALGAGGFYWYRNRQAV